MRQKRRPYQVLMDECSADSSLWDLETHIAGCFAGYNQKQEFGTAVYFALEILWESPSRGNVSRAMVSPRNLARPAEPLGQMPLLRCLGFALMRSLPPGSHTRRWGHL